MNLQHCSLKSIQIVAENVPEGELIVAALDQTKHKLT